MHHGIVGGELAVLQAAMFDGLTFNPFAPFDDGCGSAELGVGRRHIVRPLVMALVVVVLGGRPDLRLKVASTNSRKPRLNQATCTLITLST